MRVLAAWLRRPFGAALAAFLALRLLSSGLAALTATLAPVWIEVEAPHDPALLAQLEEGGRMLQLLAAPWYRWDTVNYIEIAQHGYANQKRLRKSRHLPSLPPSPRHFRQEWPIGKLIGAHIGRFAGVPGLARPIRGAKRHERICAAGARPTLGSG